jgi:hypothetical protein
VAPPPAGGACRPYWERLAVFPGDHDVEPVPEASSSSGIVPSGTPVRPRDCGPRCRGSPRDCSASRRRTTINMTPSVVGARPGASPCGALSVSLAQHANKHRSEGSILLGSRSASGRRRGSAGSPKKLADPVGAVEVGEDEDAGAARRVELARGRRGVRVVGARSDRVSSRLDA